MFPRQIPLVRAQFDLITPTRLEGSWLDEPAIFGPSSYEVNGQVALAYSCPCDWIANGTTPDTPLIAGHILLLTDALCTPACSAELAACASSHLNATGVMMSRIFNRLPEAPTVGAAPPPPPLTGELDNEAAYKVELLSFTAEVAANERAAKAVGCSPRLPTSVISSNWSHTLRTSVLWSEPLLTLNETVDVATTSLLDPPILNVTLRRQYLEAQIDCRKYEGAPLVFVVAVPVWLFLSLAWYWNTYHRNLADAKDLHRLMCWVPILQFVHGTLSMFNYHTCPWDSILALVYATFWSIVTILKEPIMLLCLLLVSKGWCITRLTLRRREVCVSGSILALLYASVSVQMSLDTPLATVPMVVMYLAILVEITWSIVSNLRILKAQLFALRNLGVDPTTTPAYTKYWMFVRLGVTVALYAALEVPIHSVFADEAMELRYFWLFLALHQALELSVACAIGYAFRARPYNILFEQVQQVANELADQMLPSITTISVKDEMLQGEGLIAWRSDLPLHGPGANQPAAPSSQQAPVTLVVLNPGDEEMPPPPRRASSVGSGGGGGGGGGGRTAAERSAPPRSSRAYLSALPSELPPEVDASPDRSVELTTFYQHEAGAAAADGGDGEHNVEGL